MKRRFLAAGLTAVIITALQPAVLRADGAVLAAERDENARTFIEAAGDAGTAAGIVSQCRSDAAPIRLAFEHAVGSLGPDQRQTLWLRYESAESTTLTALAKTRTLSCDDTNGIIHRTLHELEQPLL